jgi:hypothetical protein
MNNAKSNIQRKHTGWEWIGRAWTLPNTMLGLLLGMTGANRFQVYDRTVEILLGKGPVLWVCERLGISAFTLGDCVLYAVPPCHNLRVHEGRHVWQYWLLGPFFLPIYYILLTVRGYHAHPLEIDAYGWEAKHCGCLYSDKAEITRKQSDP